MLPLRPDRLEGIGHESRPGEVSDMSSLYYKPSGKFSISGLVMAIGLGVAGMAIGSWVYGYLMAWIPFVYVLVFGVIGYACAGAFVAGGGIAVGKIRNIPVALVIGTVVGAFAVYAAWVTWYYAWTSQQEFVYRPEKLLGVIQTLAVNGVWGMSGFTPTGWGLYLFWIVEALGIMAGTIFGAYTAVADTPFCEDCEVWLDDAQVIGAFENSPYVQEVQKGLEMERVDVLDKLVPIEQRDDSFLLASLECCGECNKFKLLSMKQVQITLDDDNKEQKQEDVLIGRLIVKDKVVDAVMSAGHLGGSSTEEPPVA